ncbi:hypothetical protein [Halobaculum limi]|uniref:hypothetical protein n=1 Tax=Halobaculum limi TaxID=3031916 RepID=UPI002404F618|nr:hypothetical protein [Halobaculum sp. YSMS11]
MWGLAAIYLINLVLYAGPLTLAGVGIQSNADVPRWFTGVVGSEPGLAMVYLAGFIQNSAYLLGFTIATFVATHLALLLTVQSKGILPTAYSVVYSSSVYVAGIFTVVWYLTTASGVAAARDFVIDIQVAFIYALIEYAGADVEYAVPRPETLAASGFSQLGEYALLSLFVLVGYFFYSLYLGARINHDADRIASAATVLVVVSLPIAYVLGSILVAT